MPCLNCGSKDTIYIGEGEHLCEDCHAITDWDCNVWIPDLQTNTYIKKGAQQHG